MHGRELALLPTVSKHPWAVPAALTLVVVTVLEVATFVEVTRTIGTLWAVVLLVACSTVGAGLLRRAIVRNRVFAVPDQPLGPAFSDTVVGLFAAALLALPGFFTAALGLILLLPPSRAVIRRLVERSADDESGDLFGPRRARVHTGAAADDASPRELTDTVDGELIQATRRAR